MSQHKARQINRIVDATITLIHDEGLSHINMSKVAQAAGVTRQTIYNYFPDIESIISSALEAHSRAIEEHLLAVIEAADGPRAKLRAFAEFQISVASSDHNNIALEAALSADMRQHLSAYTASIKQALKAAVCIPVLGDEPNGKINPDIASELLWEMVEAAAAVAQKHPNEKDVLLDAVDQAMWAILRG